MCKLEKIIIFLIIDNAKIYSPSFFKLLINAALQTINYVINNYEL